MKQLDLIRLICSPVRFRTGSHENALTASEIADLLAQKNVLINPEQIERMMNYVVLYNDNYFKENGKYFYMSADAAMISR
ncbi:MAG: hypothetical protein DWQ10_00920 [Calditrichaeota bacterium]|nr:MAG: hypothetical protein DWQ10_00920 [Calditrichota bacterium]